MNRLCGGGQRMQRCKRMHSNTLSLDRQHQDQVADVVHTETFKCLLLYLHSGRDEHRMFGFQVSLQVVLATVSCTGLLATTHRAQERALKVVNILDVFFHVVRAGRLCRRG